VGWWDGLAPGSVPHCNWGVTTRWSGSDSPRGDDYDARWDHLTASGAAVHGEADLVDALLRERGGRRVLDAGCGTGRVAIELAARGYDVVGTDLDDAMLATARRKAPALEWVTADLADLGAAPALAAPVPFDLVVLAGNVMIFLAPDAEGAVLSGVADRLVPGGRCVAGFQVRSGRLSVEHFDLRAAAVGLEPVARYATWDRDPYRGGDYVVLVHERG